MAAWAGELSVQIYFGPSQVLILLGSVLSSTLIQFSTPVTENWLTKYAQARTNSAGLTEVTVFYFFAEK